MPELDFQPRRPGLLAVVLFAAGLFLALDAWFEDTALREKTAAVESRLAQAQRRSERLQANQRQNRPENVFTPEEAGALRQAFGAIAVDWERLYGAIDAATSDDVALVAVRPSVSAKSVQISGEARDMAAALAFVEALRRAPLAQVVLVSHQLKQSDPQRPYAFEIAALWLPAS